MMTLGGHQDAVTCLMFDSTRVVSGSLDHNLKFWDIHTGDCLNTIDWKKAEGHTDVVRCLQADSWRVVSAADDKTIKVRLLIIVLENFIIAKCISFVFECTCLTSKNNL